MNRVILVFLIFALMFGIYKYFKSYVKKSKHVSFDLPEKTPSNDQEMSNPDIEETIKIEDMSSQLNLSESISGDLSNL
jgi:hypothetical protein